MADGSTAPGTAPGKGVTAASGAGFAQARRTKLARPVLMLGGVLLVAVVAFLFWLTGGRYVACDDTYVDAAKSSISTDVSGLVAQVNVKDNQHVVAGQVLFSLGQSQFDIQVASARAELAQAVLDVAAAKRSYAQAMDEIAAQKAQLAGDNSNLEKYTALVGKGGVTRATFDDARFKLQGDKARLNELQDEAGVQLAKLAGNAEIPVAETPQYQAALANLNNAKLQQAHSIVTAPYAGTVTMVAQLQPGMYLPAGSAAFGLVSDTNIWITAQPKESDLTWVRPGQSVAIKVDTYPGQSWKGVVESISPASGAEFSILPAQNSSGNWVKVVQRIPVRVKIVSGPVGLVLRDGMSAEISIDTRHRRHLLDLF